MNKRNYNVGVFDILIGVLAIFLFLVISTLVIFGFGEKKPMEDEAVAVSAPKMEGDQYLAHLKKSDEFEIRVYREAKDEVEVMSMEEYIKGVVAAEMPAEFQEEALRAQSVAARTYALSHMKKFGGIPCLKAKDKQGDICDTTHCQAYIDEKERKKRWAKYYKDYEEKIAMAVEGTLGEVITYEGEPIDSPYYFAASSGMTEEAGEVFIESRDYLRSVKSYGDSDAPKFTSEKSIDKMDFIRKIKNEYGVSDLYKNELMDQIQIISLTEAGNVKTIKVGNVEIAGTEFRRLFSLNSADFMVSDKGDDIIFHCAGYGHEVGMSQWGANGMAKMGKDYREILTHYYSDCEVDKIYQ